MHQQLAYSSIRPRGERPCPRPVPWPHRAAGTRPHRATGTRELLHRASDGARCREVDESEVDASPLALVGARSVRRIAGAAGYGAVSVRVSVSVTSDGEPRFARGSPIYFGSSSIGFFILPAVACSW